MKRQPGHLKERNHFDSKDMILLVVTMLVIYCLFSIFISSKTYGDEVKKQNQVTESVQTNNASESDGTK